MVSELWRSGIHYKFKLWLGDTFFLNGERVCAGIGDPEEAYQTLGRNIWLAQASRRLSSMQKEVKGLQSFWYMFSLSLGNHSAFWVPQSKWPLHSTSPFTYVLLLVNHTLFYFFVPQEALQRELVLKQKMLILQDLLSTLIRASDSSWKVREWNFEQSPGTARCTPLIFLFHST